MPNCPNCGRPMLLAEEPDRSNDQHAFRCEVCNLVYFTEDHTPIAGGQTAHPIGPNSSAKF
jgi:transposase-like protein